MSDPLLIFGEAAYLTMLARRTLNFAKDAKERGEEYHDMTPLTRLQCGAKARLRFTETVSGHEPVVEVKHKDADEAQQIADEIVGKPMLLSQVDQEYKRIPQEDGTIKNEKTGIPTYTFTRKIP